MQRFRARCSLLASKGCTLLVSRRLTKVGMAGCIRWVLLLVATERVFCSAQGLFLARRAFCPVSYGPILSCLPPTLRTRCSQMHAVALLPCPRSNSHDNTRGVPASDSKHPAAHSNDPRARSHTRRQSYDPFHDDDQGTYLERVIAPALIVCSGTGFESAKVASNLIRHLQYT